MFSLFVRLTTSEGFAAKGKAHASNGDLTFGVYLKDWVHTTRVMNLQI